MSDAANPTSSGEPERAGNLCDPPPYLPGSKSTKTFGFGLNGLKKYPELIPVVSIVSCAVMGATSFMLYSLLKKPDVQVFRGNGFYKTEWETVKPTEQRKLHVINPDLYKPIPDLEELKREIGSFKG